MAHLVVDHACAEDLVIATVNVPVMHDRAHELARELHSITAGLPSEHSTALAAEIAMLWNEAENDLANLLDEAYETGDGPSPGIVDTNDLIAGRVANELLFGNGKFRTTRRKR